MRRRDFLRFLVRVSAGTAACVLSDPFRPRLGFAQDPSGRTLVVIFQRGGCDGLNTVVPFGDPHYPYLRPDIGIAAPQAGNALAAIDLDGFFGLHPALAPLASLFAAGDLAVFPAVHYPDGSRSHFDGQRFIESAAKASDLDGWLNRHLVTLPQPAALRAVAFEAPLPHALRGHEIVSSFTNVANFTLGLSPQDEEELLTELGRVYSQQPDSSKAYRDLIAGSGRVMMNDLAVLSGIDTAGYRPENGAVYPATPFGTQLRQIAQLIKEDLGLEVATVSTAGWDTHSDQGGAAGAGHHATCLRELAEGIAALHADLGARRDSVLILTMTEFGRTALQNASFGTDHGHASAWFAAGGSVNGGIYGAWPGLRVENLVQGRYLAHTVDFRDVLAEVLTAHLGNPSTAAVIPGYSPQALGFIGATI